MEDINKLTEIIIGSAIKVHKTLGPGLFESVYESCLYYELEKQKIKVLRQVPIDFKHDDIMIDCGFRADLIVEDSVIVELKSVKELNDIHFSQILTYLKLSKLKIGLLINFNVKMLIDGVKRVINKE